MYWADGGVECEMTGGYLFVYSMVFGLLYSRSKQAFNTNRCPIETLGWVGWGLEPILCGLWTHRWYTAFGLQV